MKRDLTATWHKASYDEFLHDRLPDLLSQRLPLLKYAAEETGGATARVTMALGRGSSAAEVTFGRIPRPNDQGVFELDGHAIVVMPVASDERLDRAEMRCVGEQMLDLVAAALGDAPEELEWTESLVRSWVPLDQWLRDFLRQSQGHAQLEQERLRSLFEQARLRHEGLYGPVQLLDDRNWLSRLEHTRRILIADRKSLVADGQLGRACPVMTPEGPNIGRVLSLAAGAAIRTNRIEIDDDSPAAALSLTAACIPFLEHTDCNRALMGANMMRQWLVPAEPEPALVQTGHEPSEPEFWCGRNLLTAFIPWGRDVFEDGLLVSQSAAARLDFPHPLEAGDKLSNRHGTKGVVSRVVPDDEMPHLSDGTSVEIVYSFIGCHSRLNHGQLREAVAGRLARTEGSPLVAAPFEAPREKELRRRLELASQPANGMEVLTLGKDGPPLKRPSTVGYVYWGKTLHLASTKLRVSATADVPGQNMGELEHFLLRDAGALANLAESFNLRHQDRPDAESLPQRVATGDVLLPGPPTPAFAELQRRLAVAGIRAELDSGRLRLSVASPDHALKLARPVPNPWLPGRELSEVGRAEDLAPFVDVLEANDRLLKLGEAPPSLVSRQTAHLAAAIRALFDALLTPDHVHLSGPSTFTGRSVIAPSRSHGWDAVGLPEEMAWQLFGPFAKRLVGAPAVEARNPDAAYAIEEAMRTRRVLVLRAPSVLPTSVLALRPVRVPGQAIRLHPMHCRPMNADFDGDQACVYLPLTESAQREAAESLSPAGQLRRHPECLDWFAPGMSALWGLAELSRTPEGLREVTELAGIDVSAGEGFATRDSLVDAMRKLMTKQGAEETLDTIERLMDRGFEVAKATGASLNPFCRQMELPEVPRDPEDHAAWETFEEDLIERIASRSDYDADDLGPQLLAVKSGTRGSPQQLQSLLCGVRIAGIENRLINQAGSLCEGLTPREYYDRCIGARRELAQIGIDTVRQAYGVRETGRSRSFSVLARAMRSRRPGMVFAHAAAIGEVDPLTDLDSRVFVGLS